MENKEESKSCFVSVLTWEQVSRLNDVLTEVVPVHGRGNFPTLEVRLKDIVARVRARLELSGIRVKDVRLNGSTASHVLVQDIGWSYKDLDVIFRVDLPHEAEFRLIKDVVLGTLLDFLPEGVNKEKITPMTLKEAYVQKLVKVNTEQDRWSLISLSNNNGRNVELKFVDSIRRQFEFSVDSFQIVLDSMLSFYEQAQMPMSQAYPTVQGESMYGDFNMAIGHLRNKLIATKRPEEIRGGGLLKYCNLLVRDFRPASEEEFKALERYMCSRFFIDFPDIGEQQRKVEAYLQSHFIGEEKSKYDYLMILRRVVNERARCASWATSGGRPSTSSRSWPSGCWRSRTPSRRRVLRHLLLPARRRTSETTTSATTTWRTRTFPRGCRRGGYIGSSTLTLRRPFLTLAFVSLVFINRLLARTAGSYERRRLKVEVDFSSEGVLFTRSKISVLLIPAGHSRRSTKDGFAPPLLSGSSFTGQTAASPPSPSPARHFNPAGTNREIKRPKMRRDERGSRRSAGCGQVRRSRVKGSRAGWRFLISLLFTSWNMMLFSAEGRVIDCLLIFKKGTIAITETSPIHEPAKPDNTWPEFRAETQPLRLAGSKHFFNHFS
ncbi:hypothetical protein L3Q82_004282 [Scortum barcoo]|uniref:Uncharacterized protein n=1 Tax=Scortum barcoo TaxID=214431 RepID=A0ACB8VJU3_9TELE|nr:hypothetical protein L3Q82_004282 [Scortum barcoo]